MNSQIENILVGETEKEEGGGGVSSDDESDNFEVIKHESNTEYKAMLALKMNLK